MTHKWETISAKTAIVPGDMVRDPVGSKVFAGNSKDKWGVVYPDRPLSRRELNGWEIRRDEAT